MLDTDLPDEPVVAWRESQSPWWAWPLVVLTLSGVEELRSVAVSANGLTVTGGRGRNGNRFVVWRDIDEIVVADDPDLAWIRVSDAPDVLLDRRHLPTLGRDDAKRERVALLRRALETSRAAER